MQIIIAKKKGFCFGVRRAIQIVFKELIKNEKIVSYGDLIHNPQMVEFLKQRGVKTIKNIEEIPPLSRVIIRAHGISPEERKKLQRKKVKIIDATCPKVYRVQMIVKKCIKEGKEVIIIGDKTHSEVKGLMGYAKNRAEIAENEKEFEKIIKKKKEKKLCIVVQTTQNRRRFEKIKKLVKSRKNVELYDTICEETDERQEEARKLAKICDAVIVVGGKNSANTRRLAEIIREEGKIAFHIEREKELPTDIKKFKKIGVTAGASTPDWLIQRVVYKLEELQVQGKSIKKFILWLWRFFIRSHLYVAFSAASLCYACSRLLGIEPSLAFEWIAASYIFAMHLLNHLTDPKTLDINYPARSDFYRKHRKLLIILGILGVSSSLAVSWFLSWKTFGAVLLLSLLGILYRFKFLPFKYKSFADIPGSKDIFLATAWALMLVFLNMFSTGKSISPNTLVVFLFAFTMAFCRSLIYSLRDLQGDLVTGIESIPVLIGETKTKILGVVVLSLSLGIMTLAYFKNFTPSLSIFLSFNLFLYILVFTIKEKFSIFYRDVLFETLIDGNLVLSFLISYIWFLIQKSCFC